MKTILITSVILFVTVFLMAQTFGPPSIGSGGPIATSPTQCPTSPAHGYSICPVETSTGGALYVSINGSAPTLLQGAPGPQGPIGPMGPAGPAGPQGPAGPVQSFNTNKCATWSGGTSGVQMTGCTQSTP